MSLCLYSTNDLLEELSNRYDHCIFAGIKEKTEEDIDILKEWHGNDFILKGLCAEMIGDIGNPIPD